MRSEFMRVVAVSALMAVFALGCGDSATSGSGHAEDGDHPGEHEPGGGDDHGGGDDGGGDDHGGGPVVDPNAGDEFARAACHGLHSEGTVVEASLEAGAGEMIMPGDTTWVVHLPDGAPSFVNLMLPSPHTDWAVFVDHPGVVVSITNPETNDRFDVTPENPNEACADDMRVDARVHIHTDGHHVVELSADGAREIRFQMVSEAGGHGGGDADVIAHGACNAVGAGAHTMIMASSTPEEALAGDVMMTGSETYHIMLPDGPAYAAIHLPTDHTDWAVFVSEPNLVLSLSNPDVGSFAVTPHNPNLACPEMLQVDSRIHIHMGGMFVVEIGQEGTGHLVFNMVSEAEGHGDGGGHDDHDEDGHGDDDGGHDDHDDGEEGHTEGA